MTAQPDRPAHAGDGHARRVRRIQPMATFGVLVAMAIAACGGGATPSPSEAPSTARTSPSPQASASPSPSPSPSQSQSPAASSGVIGTTGTVEIAGEGFRITLADGWRAIDLDQDSIGAITDLFPSDSEIGKLLQSQAGSLALAGVKLFAIDPRPGSIVSGVAPNLNVIVQPKPPGLSIELLGTVAQSQLEALEAFSDIAIENVTLPAGPAVKATYKAEQALAGGSTVEALGRQYYLASDDSLFIVTMTGGSDDSAATFDAMAESIEID